MLPPLRMRMLAVHCIGLTVHINGGGGGGSGSGDDELMMIMVVVVAWTFPYVRS